MKTRNNNIEVKVMVSKPVTRRGRPVHWRRPALVQLMWLAAFGASGGMTPALALDQAAPHGAPAVVAATVPVSQPVRKVNFGQERASPDAHHVADWIVDAHDNRGLPFAIVDKVDAKVYVFYADGRLRGASRVLLGSAVGDDSVPGIGKRPLSTILPEERTTPAGRFVADLDKNLKGKQMLWVDYDSAISLHPVVTSKAEERRAERLASSSTLDKRISYGCINVPPDFFKTVVSPAFTKTSGIVYVLPETRSPQKVFASYDVDERARVMQARQADAGLPAQLAAQAGAN
ncbi:hypothetical protein [Rhodoferax sp.]|uniref:hypothetical protein n=1 Tax=Rhodoferax sp. TaxID=50421 RepID=UPI00374CC20B